MTSVFVESKVRTNLVIQVFSNDYSVLYHMGIAIDGDREADSP